jgi:CheY-like chemotaxis protein
MAIYESYIFALNSSFERDETYHYRWVCREYSKRFHTPLNEVYDLPIVHVAQNVYEDILQDNDPEELLEKAYSVVYPDSEDEIEEYINEILEEEKAKQEVKAASLGQNDQSLPKVESSQPKSSLPSSSAKTVNYDLEEIIEDDVESGDLDGLESLRDIKVDEDESEW